MTGRVSDLNLADVVLDAHEPRRLIAQAHAEHHRLRSPGLCMSTPTGTSCDPRSGPVAPRELESLDVLCEAVLRGPRTRRGDGGRHEAI